jgi:hypothetical protein
MLGERWKALSDTDRRPYEEKAATDKKRYEEEKASYNVCKLNCFAYVNYTNGLQNLGCRRGG